MSHIRVLCLALLATACTMRPMQVPMRAQAPMSPTMITQIALFGSRGCAVMGDESLRCWSGSGVPVPVLGLDSVRVVALGERHTCVIVTGGKVFCWGSNSSGQLGDGTTRDSAAPVEVDLGFGVAAEKIAVGAEHTCVIVNGQPWVKCWGRNDHGQLGNGQTGARSPRPVDLVPGAMPVDFAPITIAAGDHHTCVIAGSASDTWCWGAGSSYQLGNDHKDDWSTPAQAPGATGMTGLAAAGNATCGVRSNGYVACWGDGARGAFGLKKPEMLRIPSDAANSGKPVETATQLALTSRNGCALRSNGTLVCWGERSTGIVDVESQSPEQGKSSTSILPVTELRGLEGVREVALGENRGCAILKDRTLRCWGL